MKPNNNHTLLPIMAFLSVNQDNYAKKTGWIIAIALMLCLPSIFSGLFADDYSQALLSQRWFDDTAPALIEQADTATLANLFTFVTTESLRSEQLIQHGLLPWWTVPEFSMVFFRPLAELTHLFDYGVLKNPVLMHLHSLLWYALLLLVLSQVFKQLLPLHLSVLALLFFAVDSTHAFTVAWLANRNAIMALLFSLCALKALDDYVKEGRLRQLAGLVVSVVLAFLSAEAGIAVGIFLLAYCVSYASKNKSLKCCILPMLAAFIVFLAWLYFYHFNGFGASGNKAYYADPMAEPYYYFQTLPQRFLLAISMLFNLLPLHHAPIFLDASTYIGGVFLVLVTAYIVKRQQSYLTFSAIIVGLSILPVASAEMQERNLLFASIGSSIILADIISCLYIYICGEKSPQLLFSKTKRYAALLFLWLIVVFHVALSALLFLPLSYAPALMAQPAKKTVAVLNQSVLFEKAAVSSPFSTQLIFTVGMPLFSSAYIMSMQAYFLADSPAEYKPLSRVFMNLSSNPKAKFVWLEAKEGFSYSFAVKADDALFSGADTLLRDVRINPFQLNDVVKLSFGELSIEQLDDAGAVLSIRVDIRQSTKMPINKGDIGLYIWKNKPVALLEEQI